MQKPLPSSPLPSFGTLSLSEQEKQLLHQELGQGTAQRFGNDRSAAIARAKAEFAKQDSEELERKLQQLQKTQKPLQVPKPRELQELSDEDQARINQMLTQYNVAPSPTGMVPEIAQALAELNDYSQEIAPPPPEFQPRKKVIKSNRPAFDPQKKSTEVPQAPPQIPPQVPPQTLHPFKKKVAESRNPSHPTHTPPKPPISPPVSPPVSPPISPSGASGSVPTNHETCPHCSMSLAVPAVEPDSEDALRFVAAILGSQEFTKRYEHLGGRLAFVFRSLDVTRSNLCMRQVAIDAAAGDITTFDDFFTRLIDYRAVLSLSELIVNDEPIDVAVAVDDYLRKHTPTLSSTFLPDLVKHMQAWAPLNRETLWRLMGQSYRHFQRLIEALEAKSRQENFWKAIDG